jgi:TatD DNase family protein
VGEIGLDFFRGISSKYNQETAFRAQVGLARMVSLPMVVHIRDAGSSARTILDEEGYAVGVLHCYSGERKMLEWALNHGMYVSLAGNLTYGDQRLTEAAKQIPRDRLMVETDSPYLAPVPERGKRNEPALLRHTVEVLARIVEATPQEIAALTRENTRRCFGIS